MNLKPIYLAIGIASVTTFAIPVFAESAPVYDVDAMQQQFDNVPEQTPPSQEMAQAQDNPPPGPDQESAFVPMQTGVEPAPAQTAPATNPVVVSNGESTVEKRLHRVEQQLNNLQNSEETSQNESLQSQVQALRDQVEKLTHELQQSQEQQKNLNLDIEKRIADAVAAAKKSTPNAPTPIPKISTLPPDGESVGAQVAVKSVATKAVVAKRAIKAKPMVHEEKTAVVANENAQPNVAEEQQIYQTAYDLIKSKKYNDAANALQGMLKKYPSGQFASNAHYWLGELYGLMGKNDNALSEFSTVVKTYPDSPRVSDAQLKVGLILSAQTKWEDAKLAFKKVINHYPGTASARLASEQLRQIKQAGH